MPNAVTGTVIKSTGSWYQVKTDEGDIKECRIRGKFRLEEIQSTNPVAVGDRVQLGKGEGEDTIVITGIEERQNYIVRRSPKHRKARHILAANLDMAYVLATMSKPRTSTGFIDRFIITAEANKIPGSIIFNKQDAYEKKDFEKLVYFKSIYENIGYPCFVVSALTGHNMNQIMALMKNKTTLLAGHSGVGKTTFINFLSPSLKLKTREISQFHEKGKHTTTFAEMFELPFGGGIIDTPGIKEFGVLDFEPEDVSHYFVEMKDRISNCKYNNCQHKDEPGCEIIEAVEKGELHSERYKNYLNILEDVKKTSRHWE